MISLAENNKCVLKKELNTHDGFEHPKWNFWIQVYKRFVQPHRALRPCSESLHSAAPLREQAELQLKSAELQLKSTELQSLHSAAPRIFRSWLVAEQT